MRKVWLFLILIFAASFIFGGFIPVFVLEVKEMKSGEIFFREKATPGDIFHFRYLHSVEKTPVEGTFLIEEDGLLRMVETRFSSHGAGLPNDEKKILRQNGWFVIQGRDRQERLRFLFSPPNRPLFKFKGKEIELGSKKGEGGLLEISTRRNPLILYLFEELYHFSFYR